MDELAGPRPAAPDLWRRPALSLTREPISWERRLSRVAERKPIGRRAAALVVPREAIFVDCGSTTAFFARALAARAVDVGVAVVTNCVAVASELAAAEEARILLPAA